MSIKCAKRLFISQSANYKFNESPDMSDGLKFLLINNIYYTLCILRLQHDNCHKGKLYVGNLTSK